MSPEFKIADLIKSATLIKHQEQRVVFISFLLVFVLMAAYYMLRPVRDAMASDWTNTEISVLWNIQFILSLTFVAIYGVAVSRINFRHLVPSVYGFFALSFVSFHFGGSLVEAAVILDKSFYLWVSLFSLFHVSVFWSLMADLYNKEQSRRLFGFIAVGASAGAIVGPIVATIAAQTIGSESLMLVASFMMLIPLPIVFYLQYLKRTALHNEQVNVDLAPIKIGGNPLAGFRNFVTNPYLIGIAAFILGFFATSRLTTKLGMPTTLALVPVFMCVALIILAFAPILPVLLGLQVARQAGNYGITRPAREMLFTSVSRETRFKAKPVVDVVIYRGGDAIWSSAFALFTDGLGLGMAAMAAIGAGISALWAGTGVKLGVIFDNRSEIADSSVKISEKNGSAEAVVS